MADVIESVSDWALEEFLHGRVELLGTRQEVIEPLQGVEEALHLVGPGKGFRMMPGGLASRHREGPIEKITNVGQDLNGGAAVLTGAEVDVTLRGIANDLATTISDRGERVTKKVARADGFICHARKLAGWTRE